MPIINYPPLPAPGSVTSVTGSPPIASSGGTTPAISIPQATSSVDGYLSSTDWTTFNNKSNTNGTVTSVAALTLGTTGTDLSSTVANGTTTPVITLNVPTASAANRGALSSTDWSTFNSKVSSQWVTTGSNIYYTTGDVGIGTSSPATKLDVRTNSSSTSLADSAFMFVANSNTTANNMAGIWFPQGNAVNTGNGAGIAGLQTNYTGGSRTTSLTFYTTNQLGSPNTPTERMRLDSSGNLGLGVTPNTWTAVARVFQVGVHGALWNSSGGTVLSRNYYNDGNARYITTAAASALSLEADGSYKFFQAASGTAGGVITLTQAMTLDASGNLGVGNTSPSTYGKFVVQSSGTPPAAYLSVIPSLSSYGQTFESTIYLGVNRTDVRANGRIVGYRLKTGSVGDTNADLTFEAGVGNFTNAPPASYVERMRIDSSGNVLVTGAGGLGYGTGSGGAVTQATSRTTGVTLDKTNGAITLVSAAGTTTWQTFTVTNNKVAATDTIVVNQKSGTDLYQIFVTNVAAGSFKISFATTGGTTTEQPVFNFAVIKAVTA